MPYKIFIAILIFGIFQLLVCNTENKFQELDEVLNKAGSNKSELIKVLRHYKFEDPDTLKFNATIYLLKNMEGHFSKKRINSTSPLIVSTYNTIHKLTIDNFFEKQNDELFNLLEYVHEILDNNDFVPTKSCIDSLIRLKFRRRSVFSKVIKSKIESFDSLINATSLRIQNSFQVSDDNNEINFDLNSLKSDWLCTHP